MTQTIKQFYDLCLLFLKRDSNKWGVIFFFIVLILNLGGVYITILMVVWTAKFYDALQQLNVEEAIKQIGIFFLLIGTNSIRALISEYLEKIVKIRWRRGLTEAVMERWMSSYNYWRMKFLPVEDQVDNPDQRIADDCRIFLTSLLDQTLGFITKIVGLFSFLILLWSLSTFPLEFQLLGYAIVIPRYMIWSAFIYVILSSCWTHFLGSPIKRLVFEQQRREADLRFSLIQIRRNSDEIAILGGSEAEKRIAEDRFEKVVINWRGLIQREFILGCFTHPYMYSVLRIPLFVALPAYLAGKISFGGLMQISQAFSNVVNALSWFIFSYRKISELVATASRLHHFLESLDQVEKRDKEILIFRNPQNQIHLKDFLLLSPEGDPLLSFPEMIFPAGCPIWLQGDSGIGKTTLFKAIAGFWPYGKGEVYMPGNNILFLPQRPYFPLGSFRDAICYPRKASEFSDLQIQRALQAVEMESVISNSSEMRFLEGRLADFSGGEQQRLALARLVLLEPQWAFLDEATSALDKECESRILQNLRKALPQTTFVMIAHNKPFGFENLREIQLARLS